MDGEQRAHCDDDGARRLGEGFVYIPKPPWADFGFLPFIGHRHGFGQAPLYRGVESEPRGQECPQEDTPPSNGEVVGGRVG